MSKKAGFLTEDEQIWVDLVNNSSLSEEEIIEKLEDKIKSTDNCNPLISFYPGISSKNASPETALINIAAQKGKLEVLKFLSSKLLPQINIFNENLNIDEKTRRMHRKRLVITVPLLYAIEAGKYNIVVHLLTEPESTVLIDNIIDEKKIQHQIFLALQKRVSQGDLNALDALDKIVALRMIDPGHLEGSEAVSSYMGSFLHTCSKLYPSLDSDQKYRMRNSIKNFIKNAGEIAIYYRNPDDEIFYTPYAEELFLEKLIVPELAGFVKTEFASERERRKNIENIILSMTEGNFISFDSLSIEEKSLLLKSKYFLLNKHFLHILNDSSKTQVKDLMSRIEDFFEQEIGLSIISEKDGMPISNTDIIEIMKNLSDDSIFTIMKIIKSAKNFKEKEKFNKIEKFFGSSKLNSSEEDVKLSLDDDDDDDDDDDETLLIDKYDSQKLPEEEQIYLVQYARTAIRKYLTENSFSDKSLDEIEKKENLDIDRYSSSITGYTVIRMNLINRNFIRDSLGKYNKDEFRSEYLNIIKKNFSEEGYLDKRGYSNPEKYIKIPTDEEINKLWEIYKSIDKMNKDFIWDSCGKDKKGEFDSEYIKIVKEHFSPEKFPDYKKYIEIFSDEKAINKLLEIYESLDERKDIPKLKEKIKAFMMESIISNYDQKAFSDRYSHIVEEHFSPEKFPDYKKYIEMSASNQEEIKKLLEMSESMKKYILELKTRIEYFMFESIRSNYGKKEFSEEYSKIFTDYFSDEERFYFDSYINTFTSSENIDKLWKVSNLVHEGNFVGAIRNYISREIANFVDKIIQYINEKIMGNPSRKKIIEKSSEHIFKNGSVKKIV
jgi:hypothetical protein